MNRKLFVLLVVLMSLSLIGIIFVQGYWIKSTVQDREEQFSYNAKQVLIEVSEQIQSSEFERYIFEYEAQLRNSEQKIDRITLTEYLIATRDEFKNEDGDTRKWAFLDNGIVEKYSQGKKDAEGKWSVVRGEIHTKYNYSGTIFVYIINTDKSITYIAYIEDGKRTERSKEDQLTYKKIK